MSQQSSLWMSALSPCSSRSFCLVDYLALRGEMDTACELFERVCRDANHGGLPAEQFHKGNGEQLANFPHAFSPAGLIGTAPNLEETGAVRWKEA